MGLPSRAWSTAIIVIIIIIIIIFIIIIITPAEISICRLSREYCLMFPDRQTIIRFRTVLRSLIETLSLHNMINFLSQLFFTKTLTQLVFLLLCMVLFSKLPLFFSEVR